MLKSKAFILSSMLAIFLLGGVLGYGVYRGMSNKEVFVDSGYILVAPENTYSDDEINTQIYFEKGTTYKKVYPNKIMFRDQKNKKRVLDADSFVHYNNGGVASLEEGVMVDMNSFDSPLTNYYGLSSDTVMECQGDNYALDNCGEEMNFQNALWKINDTKYLLLSSNITVKFSEANEHVFKDYIEIDYYDTGIIRIVSAEGTWETVSQDCTATLDNGVILNLYNRTIVKDNQVKLSLNQMVVNSDQNINIIPEEVKNKSNKAPKLDIQTIDGTNGEAGKAGEAGEAGEHGEDGEEGEQGLAGTEGTAGADGTNGQNGVNGEAGNPGEPGLTGTTGMNGQNGANGSYGANGAAGANGQKGEEGAKPIDNGTTKDGEIKATLPEFNITSMEAKTNSVKANIVVTDEENRLDPSKDFTVEIVENSTGKRVYMTQIDSGNRDFPVEYNGLVPDKEYRLVLTAEYTVNNANYSNMFINKVFMTDSLGIIVTKNSASDVALSFKVTVKDYCQVSEADLQLLDKDGNAIRTNEIHMALAKLDGEEIVTFNSLISNTVYKVKLVNVKLNYDMGLVTSPQLLAQDYMTLKKSPTLGNPEVVTNKRDGSFEFHLSTLTDTDKAIKRLRYEIYEVGLDSSEILVKTLKNTTNDVLSCYVDNTTIKRNYNYRIRVVAECYDNEKEVEFASSYSALFSMKGDNFPILLFQKNEDESHHDDIAGSLLIDTNGTKLIVDSNNTLIIELKNTKGDVDNIFINEVTDKVFLGSNQYRYTIPIKQNNLKANETYIISVYGTIDLNDGAGANKNSLVGNIVTSTDEPKGFKAGITQDSDLVSPISFRVSLADALEDASSIYEAGTMKYVEVNLYNGDETAVTNEPPVATYTITGTEANPLKNQLYGTNSILLTASDFNISASTITSSKYTVEISAVRDYTRYGNTFTVQNNIQTFTKQATLPDLSSMDINNGLTVIPITLANISQYVNATEAATYQKYDSDIVFGYEIRAAYFDNSAQLIETFDYYAYEEKDYTTATTPAPTTSTDFYALNLHKAIISKTVTESGAVPSAVLLFGKNEAVNMSRGSRYVFTYRAKMKQPDSSGITYFPDTQSTSAIIRSKAMRAPYQQPRFYFYPWISTAGSATWKYYVDAPDTSAVIGNFTVTKGNITAGAAPKLNVYDSTGNVVEVTVGGLTRGDIYSLRIVTSQYKAIYAASVTNTLIGQYFEGDYTFLKATTSLSYEMEDISAQNRYRITVNDSDVSSSSLSRVVALKVSVYQSGATVGAPLKTVIVPFDYITSSSTGGAGVGFLRYSDIKELIGRTLAFKITAVYDSGISGFKDTVNAYCAVQLLPASGKGNYLMPNSTNTALVENSTGNAMSSYYQIQSMSNATSSTSFNYVSAIENSFSGTLSFSNNGNGARLTNINGQPYATLKATREVDLHITDNSTVDFTEFTFDSMTPTVNLNRGAAYTIDTTVTSATVHWELSGHDEKLDVGDIRDNTMYFDLYRITPLGAKEDLHRTIPTVIQKGKYKYDTLIDSLTPDNKYGIVIYYIDNSTGLKVYPINAYLPDKEPSSNIYTFTTSTTITVTPSAVPVRYVAVSYLDKYLEINYKLNQTLGFDINYSICEKQGSDYKVLLTSEELSSRGIIKTPLINKEDMSGEKIILSPGKLYWKDASNKTVYFPFNSTDYYLCIKPVSETNSTIELGTPVYVQLNVTPLNTPFYKIKTVPGVESVTFQVSVLDIGKVMVGGHYKVKILNGSGTDITPVDIIDDVFSITSPISIKITDLDEGDKAIIHLYAVHDMLNTGKAADDSILVDINTVEYDNLDAIGKNYLKVSYTGYPLNNSGYDLGDVQIQQCSSEHARVYFTDSVNLDMIKYIRYVVVNESGGSFNYYEPFSFTELNSNSSYYELSHQFTSTGVYQIQIRFYDESKTQLDDLALTYYKSY